MMSDPLDDIGFEAAAIVCRLDLQPHPEGGFYRETWRDPAPEGARGSGTAIYFLLAAGQRSQWHRVDAAEVWHFYRGAPLALEVATGDGQIERHVLGPDLDAGERPQITVPAGAWQAAESLGDYTLVGCTVSPAFAFEGFELAPPGWSPGDE
jgi:predicted cupin superfamily sugar epimerase